MQSKHKILTLPIRLALIVLIIGALFKVMHWPYSKELMLIGGGLVSTLYTIRFLFKKQKNRMDYVKIAFVLLWLSSYLINVFHIYSLPYVFNILIVGLFIWWFIEEGLNYFKNRKHKVGGAFRIIYYLFCYLTFIAMFLGILIKILHWPYGSLVFTIGVLSLCLLIIIDYFVVE